VFDGVYLCAGARELTDEEHKDIAIWSLKSVDGSHSIFVLDASVKHLAIVFGKDAQIRSFGQSIPLTIALDEILQHFEQLYRR
jgi:hypothetical protein